MRAVEILVGFIRSHGTGDDRRADTRFFHSKELATEKEAHHYHIYLLRRLAEPALLTLLTPDLAAGADRIILDGLE